MKLEKINIDGKKDSIEVLDKIFSSKKNKQLVSNVLYKINANYKRRKAKTKQKNEIKDRQLKFMHKKVLVMQGMLVEKRLFLLEVVLLTVQKVKQNIKLEN